MPADDAATGNAMHAELPTACQNCTTPLQGAYCHVCGQHGPNPLRHFGHALEDVFESFWHLDGRVFRTLRELPIPGRVACNYLAGHRVRYIAPLRLFVVVSLLTFLFGQGLAARVPTGPTVRFDDEAAELRAGGASEFATARTEADVRRELDEKLAGLRTARDAIRYVPNSSVTLDAAERQLRAAADARIAALAREAGTMPAASAPAGAAAPARTAVAAPATPRAAADARPASAAPPSAKPETGTTKEPDPQGTIDAFFRDTLPSARLRDPKLRWHHETNPADLPWIPAFADGWINTKLHVAGQNAVRFSKGEGDFFVAFVAAMPTGLFVMMPVFALLLKLFYIRHRHGVLEHLVVALYSHVFLLLALLALMLLGAAVPENDDSLLAALPGLGIAALLVYIPVYLLLMQRRVYAQGWPKTLAKFVLIGNIYFWLLGGAAAIAALMPFLTADA